MNKKALSAFRRQLKSDSYSLKISMLYTAYVKKDNKFILHAEQTPFDMKGEAEQEIYLSGFKKLLTGGLNTKLFELPFDDSAQENEGQALCVKLLSARQENYLECCNAFIERLSTQFYYDTDIVVTIARGKYSKPMGKKSRKGEEASLDGFDDTTFGVDFILCSVSRADESKRGIYYSADSKRFELSAALNKDILLTNPIEGFMYPAIGDFGSDISKLLYYTGAANVRNEALLEHVLNCRYDLTAKEERERFEELLRQVTGGKIRPEVFKNINGALNEKLGAESDSGETVTLSATEIKQIFEESGLKDLEGFDDAYEQSAEHGYIYSAANLIGGTRTVRITTGVSELDISLENLVSVRQVINARGRKCLEIELDDDAVINGISLETERN
jgi:hypothetical protein